MGNRLRNPVIRPKSWIPPEHAYHARRVKGADIDTKYPPGEIVNRDFFSLGFIHHPCQ